MNEEWRRKKGRLQKKGFFFVEPQSYLYFCRQIKPRLILTSYETPSRVAIFMRTKTFCKMVGWKNGVGLPTRMMYQNAGRIILMEISKRTEKWSMRDNIQLRCNPLRKVIQQELSRK